MCGIAGVAYGESSPISRETGLAMAKAIAHRGPDRQAVWCSAGVVLAHARLSVLELSAAGDQPMVTPCGRFTIVFNGEIYNYRELRAGLEAMGEHFRGNSDTDVLLRLFAREGVACLSKLNGIFAFAVWDSTKACLTLARDRFGTKPLYYASMRSGLWFASEIKAIRVGNPGLFSLRRERLAEFLYYGVVSDGATMFAEVERVQPGGYTVWDATGVTHGVYWCPEDVPASQPGINDAATETHRLLEQAVRRQLVADVPVGVFLSGGIDSSAVATFASRHYAGRLRTFSVGFDYDRGVNELPRAARTAARLQTEHEELHVTADGLEDVVVDLVRHHDEPFSEGANIPLFLLCRALGGGTKVVLQGDGGDELFGGYRRYGLLARGRLLRMACRSILAIHAPLPERHRRMAEALATPDDGVRMALLMSLERCTPSPVRVLAPGLRAMAQATDPFRRYRDLDARFGEHDPVQRMLLSDTQALLPDLYLEKVDKSTMAFGIEARVPFLDHELTDFAISLPSSLKVRGNQKKFLLRRALRGVLPDEVLDGPKTGFGVPYVQWIQGPLHGFAREVILAAATGPDPWFDEVVIKGLLDRLRDDGRGGFLLWKCLHLALWRDQQAL